MATRDETMGKKCPHCGKTEVEWLSTRSNSYSGDGPGKGGWIGRYRCLRAECGKEFDLPRRCDRESRPATPSTGTIKKP